MKLKCLTFSRLIAFFVLACCLVPCAKASAQDLTQSLVDKFKTRVTKLDRELLTFRYEEKTTFEPQTMKDVADHESQWTGLFYDSTNIQRYAAGPGVYTAIDPYSTRSFGGQSPQLYVLAIKKDSVILNLATSLTSDEQQLISSAFTTLKCDSNSGDSSGHPDFFSLRNSSVQACRDLSIAVAKQLHVQAILYNYSAAQLQDCRLRVAAINVVSPDAFDFDRSAFFSDSHTIQKVQIGAYVKNLFNDGKKDVLLALQSSDVSPTQIPGTLGTQPDPDQKTYHAWKAAKIYNCGANWSPESALDPTSIVILSARKNYQDSEISSLLLKMKTLATAKSPGKYFSFYNFILPMRLSFKGLGLTQDDATFNRWMYLMRNYYDHDDLNQELKTIFNSSTSAADLENKLDDIVKFVNSMSQADKDKPTFVMDVLEHFGISQGLALAWLDQIITSQAGVPMSSFDPNKSFQENFQISKAAYKASLQDCIAKYSDPTLSYDDIQKTDCGARDIPQP